jgi:uncharacterized protein YjbI with pentapeptide repeats
VRVCYIFSMISMSSDDVTKLVLDLCDEAKRVAFEKVDFAGIDLSKRDLSGLKTRRIGLANANLAGANGSGLSLAGADLTAANLSACVFEDLAADKVKLTRAVLAGARFTRSSLEKANFSRANAPGLVSDCNNMLGSTFEAANLVGSTFQNHTSLSGANFEDADLRQGRFEHIELTHVRFARADLRGASFVDCDVSGADFAGTNIETAHFERVVADKKTTWPGAVPAGVDGAAAARKKVVATLTAKVATPGSASHTVWGITMKIGTHPIVFSDASCAGEWTAHWPKTEGGKDAAFSDFQRAIARFEGGTDTGILHTLPGGSVAAVWCAPGEKDVLVATVGGGDDEFLLFRGFVLKKPELALCMAKAEAGEGEMEFGTVHCTSGLLAIFCGKVSGADVPKQAGAILPGAQALSLAASAGIYSVRTGKYQEDGHGWSGSWLRLKRV